MSTPSSKQSIRRDMRAKRIKLSKQDLAAAASKLESIVKNQAPWLLQAKRIFSYVPFEGEISPKSITNSTSDSEIFLPKILDYQSGLMEFLPANAELRENQFGINEPVNGKPISAQEADLILVPLTAFDSSGNRLGMGAGFYDRALSTINRNSHNGPLIVGLAHHFQKIQSIPTDHWDVPLDAIISDEECIKVSDRFSSNTGHRKP